MNPALLADFHFAAESLGSEFQSKAPMLRYVAAINHGCSLAEFVEAGQSLGHHAGSLRNRFWESRRFDTENYGTTFDKEGRVHEH